MSVLERPVVQCGWYQQSWRTWNQLFLTHDKGSFGRTTSDPMLLKVGNDCGGGIYLQQWKGLFDMHRVEESAEHDPILLNVHVAKGVRKRAGLMSLSPPQT